MEPFLRITSPYISLPLNNVDTDMIIPAQYLTMTTVSGYGDFLFARLRAEDPEFPFNTAQKEGKILVAGENFGCGSSREHAVWALREWGIRVVIAPFFADIFAANSAKNGVLLIALPLPIIEKIWAQEKGSVLSVDLKNQILTLPDGTTQEFFYDPFRKECLLHGYDDLDYLLAHIREIRAHQQKTAATFWYSTLEPNYPLEH